jgi:hypothetical protein
MLKQGQKWKIPWSKYMNKGSNNVSMVVGHRANLGEIFMNFGAMDN